MGNASILHIKGTTLSVLNYYSRSHNVLYLLFMKSYLINSKIYSSIGNDAKEIGYISTIKCLPTTFPVHFLGSINNTVKFTSFS